MTKTSQNQNPLVCGVIVDFSHAAYSLRLTFNYCPILYPDLLSLNYYAKLKNNTTASTTTTAPTTSDFVTSVSYVPDAKKEP